MASCVFFLYRTEHDPPQLCYNMSIYNGDEVLQNMYCLEAASQYYSGSDSDFDGILEEECGKYRLPPCKSYGYIMTQASRRWPMHVNQKRSLAMKRFAEFMGGDLPAQEAVEFVTENYASVEVTVKNAKSKVMKQSYEYLYPQLISDVGGTLGLWLGLSFVGMFELFEVALVILRYLIEVATEDVQDYRKEKRKQRVRKMQHKKNSTAIA